jgi:carboxyl-terminal processing protease
MKRKLQHPITSVLLAIIVLVLLGYAFDKYHSVHPVEYVVSTVEGLDNSPSGAFKKTWRIVKNSYLDSTLNHQDWGKWKKRYISEIKNNEDLRVATETMLASLDDPFTRFLPKDDFDEQHRSIDSKLQGIGVHISEIEGKIIVVSVIEETPAEKYGLKKKDEILKVDSTLTKGVPLKEVADLIRGKKGSYVTLTILRDNKELVKKIKREEIKIKTVKHKMLDNNIAYIKIVSFISSDTSNEFTKALLELKNASGLIVDVRGNYGGLLSNAILISDIFLDKGNIVSIVDRKGKRTNYYAEKGCVFPDIPMAVLVDEASASASEIFSGALQDNKRAILVGEKTFGKGLVQMITELPNGSGINLTVAKYLTPSGRDINKKGIEPDYKVVINKKNPTKETDEQLEKAVDIILEQMRKQPPSVISTSS